MSQNFFYKTPIIYMFIYMYVCLRGCIFNLMISGISHFCSSELDTYAIYIVIIYIDFKKKTIFNFKNDITFHHQFQHLKW